MDASRARKIWPLLLVTLAAFGSNPAAASGGPDPRGLSPAGNADGRLRLAAEDGSEDEAWKRLEAEQERRRQRREGKEPAVKLKPALPAPVRAERPPGPGVAAKRPVARPAPSRPARMREPVRPAQRLEPVRTATPRPARAAAAARAPDRVAACYAQVGVQVDGSGRPISGLAVLALERTQSALQACLDRR